jgi:hypothetical protein
MNAMLRKITFTRLPRTVMILGILVEVLWAYCWLIWLGFWPSLNWSATPLNFISAFAQALFTGFLARAALGRNWSSAKLRWVVLPASLLLLLILLRWNNANGYWIWDKSWLGYASSHLSLLVIGFAFGIYLSWRGISSTREEVTFSDLYRKFVIGIVGLILLLVVWGLARSSMPSSWSKIGVYLILFFGVGLLALALANLENLRTELSKHQELSSSFNRRWVSILVILVIAILGISIAIMGAFSSNFVSTILHGLSVGAGWLLTGVAYLLYPVGLLVTAIYYVVQWIIHLIRGGAEPPKFTLPDFSDLQKQAEGQPTAHIPLWILLLLKWGVLILLAAFLIFLLSRALIRFWQGKDLESADDEHETLFSWGLLRSDLAGFWSWLFSRWRKKRPGGAVEIAAVKLEPIDSTADRDYDIRELYRALLWRGSQYGIPRKTTETPYEYEQRLESSLAGSGAELEPITSSYVRARYGEHKEPPERIAFLNRLWRTLRDKLVRKD